MSEQAQAGVLDENALRRVVIAFYSAAREDSVLGPVFDSVVTDWPEHFEKLTAFWSSVMLGVKGYRGNPLAAHVPHGAKITPAMFDRWLDLWCQAAGAHLSAQDARAVCNRAALIAESLKLGLFFKPGS